MRYTINKRYVLRRNALDNFILYDKYKLIEHTITAKMYFLLRFFLLKPCSFDDFNEYCRKESINTQDFYDAINSKDLSDLLVETQNDKEKVKYNDYVGSSLTMRCPERVEFLITRRCNLKCPHCFESSAPILPIDRISHTDICKFADQLDIANVKTVKITGGEPFVHPDIDDVLNVFTDHHFETLILTNGLLLNDERIDFISKNHIQLGISLDGVNSQSYDYIRGKGNFKKLHVILNKLKSKGVIFTLTCTVNKINISDIKNIVHVALEDYGAQFIILGRLRPMGRGKENNGLSLSDEQQKYVLKFYEQEKQKYKDRITLADDSILRPLDTDVISCSAGNSVFGVDAKFNVYPCVFGIGHPQYMIGNLIDDGIENIWHSKKWDIFRGKTLLKDLTACSQCAKNKKCVMKNCRMRPVFEGRDFYDAISYCDGTES